MDRVKTIPRLLAALAAVAGFLLALTIAQQSRLTGSPASLDRIVVTLLGGAALFSGAFFAGHIMLRSWGRRGALDYAALGALAALLSFFGTTGTAVLRLAMDQKLVSLAIGLPLLVGALLGFVYRTMAGATPDDGDRVPAIEAALAAAEDPSPALLGAEQGRYFSGPMQVRFSLPLIFAAGAALGAIMAAIVVVLMLAATLSGGHHGDDLIGGKSIGVAVSMVLGFGCLMFIPTLIGHYAAQYFGKTSAGAYVAYGVAANILLGLVTGIFLIAAPFAAASLALYRRLAGLEPVGLPDDVRVRDERALIGADHPARRYHRVIVDAPAPATR